MSPCFETIKSINGALQHLVYHQARFDKTRLELFGDTSKIPLGEILTPPLDATYRVRVEYDEHIRKIEYIPYAERHFSRFMLHETALEYPYKYVNREALNMPLPQDVDDVIFTHNGELKDTRIANIALLIDGEWKTPLKPLLEGTTLCRLLGSGLLKAEVLDVKSLQNAQKFAIMNALIGFYVVENLLIKE